MIVDTIPVQCGNIPVLIIGYGGEGIAVFVAVCPGGSITAVSPFLDLVDIIVFVSISPKQQNNTKLPENIYLAQNYPNPFNGTTTIRFTLQKAALVKLKIYNVLGQEVASMVSSRLNTGEHQYHWNSENLPSGIYFYELNVENFVERKKLLLIK